MTNAQHHAENTPDIADTPDAAVPGDLPDTANDTPTAFVANPAELADEVVDGVLPQHLADLCDPVDPDPVLDPRSYEGAAILSLFTIVKNIEAEYSGDWNGCDVVDALTEWFTGLGIDISRAPDDVAQTLHRAVHAAETAATAGWDGLYTVELSTTRDDPEPLVIDYVALLVDDLGEHTVARVIRLATRGEHRTVLALREPPIAG